MRIKRVPALYLALSLVIISLLLYSCQSRSTSSPTISQSLSSPPGAIDTLNPPATNFNAGAVQSQHYIVFAWNDLGMHCLNPTYDTLVILPPYNTIWAQVVERGNPPKVVVRGFTAEYRIINNTYSYGKRSYGQFWDSSQKIFGVPLEKNTGLNLKDPPVHNSLSGTMIAKNDHFEVDGIPLTPVDDNGNWNPYQVAEITVKDPYGKVIARTKTTAPVSDEINCAKCHGGADGNAFQDILAKHDQKSGTDLVNQKPVLCAGCHGDPALGQAGPGQADYLSASVHGFHSRIASSPSCYDCHPGADTLCSRSLAHTAPDGNCTTCHGDLSNVALTINQGTRTPWTNEPGCATCHSGVGQVITGDTLYRNAAGHGGIYCAGCHGSPHAMVPTNQISDNYQFFQYQGKDISVGSCAVCHLSSRGGEDFSEFGEVHAGTDPQVVNACFICHTGISIDTAKWPHAFQWKSRPD